MKGAPSPTFANLMNRRSSRIQFPSETSEKTSPLAVEEKFETQKIAKSKDLSETRDCTVNSTAEKVESGSKRAASVPKLDLTKVKGQFEKSEKPKEIQIEVDIATESGCNSVEQLSHKIISNQKHALKTMQISISFKIIIIGDSAVGKTALFKRFLQNEFKTNNDVTISVEFGAYLLQVEDDVLKLQMWDTAGQEQYKSISKVFYRNAQAAIICYSTTDLTSYENVDRWMNEVKASCPEDVQVFLCGTKADQSEKCKISTKKALEL